MTDIETRIASLEKTNARLRIMAVVLAVIITSATLVGAAPKKAAKGLDGVADELKAKRIAIVDDDGNERIIMEVAEKKFSELKSEKRKAVFATIKIVTSEGTESLSLDATNEGYTRLKLFDEEGRRRIEAVTSPDPSGFAKLFFYDTDGKEVMKKFP